ncbi:MAG TPA: phosphoribosylformylglycinamidine cyclo-ligase [Thermomicrobiales bacterium]|nr:phosphoribosylformylglycinamidine cyclo-ligase [Thermomicrobiales bacterium]
MADGVGPGADTASRQTLTYREAGVDIDAASAAVDRVKSHAHATFAASGAAAPIGHFGGVYRLDAGSDRLLVASADGVGTKLKLAFVLGGEAHARVGADLVNHCVNDILACGARPLFFLDYVAMGRLDGDVLESLVGGMAAACRENGLALIGGETAEMPGLYAIGEYDAAGFIVGTVEPESFVDGSAVRAGDVLIGLPSAGLHTNGFSLARRILGLTGDAEVDRRLLARSLPGDDQRSIGEALLAPHLTYLPQLLPLVQQGLIHGMAHITGGGLIDNVPRMLPEGLVADFDPATWTVNPIFAYLVLEGQLPPGESYRAFNMGLGFVLAVSRDRTGDVLAALPTSRVVGIVAEAFPEAGLRVRGLSEGGVSDG